MLFIGTAALVLLWGLAITRSQPEPAVVTQEVEEPLSADVVPSEVEPIHTQQDLDVALTQLDETKVDHLDAVLEQLEADAAF